MNINSIGSNSYSYPTSKATTSQDTKEAQSNSSKAASEGVIYEKSTPETKQPNTYSVSRDDVVARLKSDAQQRSEQLSSMVRDMMKQQGAQVGNADSIWRFLASGNFTVTAEAKAQAQAAISEDGYWGVTQTSDRIVEFAKALSGGDPEKADLLFNAFEKGFKEATKSWGQKLPQISQDTYSAVKDKFDAWKNSAE